MALKSHNIVPLVKEREAEQQNGLEKRDVMYRLDSYIGFFSLFINHHMQ